MRIINDIKCIIIKKLPRSIIVYNERRELGLQIANFEKRKMTQKQKQAREQRIKTDVWLG
jgi:hypothetical protein